MDQTQDTHNGRKVDILIYAGHLELLRSGIRLNKTKSVFKYSIGSLSNDLFFKTITIHHERPWRIEISHPRGRNFNQGRGLPSPWLNSDPEGEISLSYMDRLMMDRFLPLFEGFLSEQKEIHENLKFLTFYSLGLHYF